MLRPLAEARDILTKMIGRLALVVAAATALAAIAGNLIARRLVRPLRTLQTAAEHIAATGDLDAPLPDPGGHCTKRRELPRIDASSPSRPSASDCASKPMLTSLGTNVCHHVSIHANMLSLPRAERWISST